MGSPNKIEILFSDHKKSITQSKRKMTDNLETQVLENGLLIEDIIFELRTEKICINALKWAIQRYNTNDYIVRREMGARIMKSFPNDILITGFVMGHLTDFS